MTYSIEVKVGEKWIELYSDVPSKVRAESLARASGYGMWRVVAAKETAQ